MSKFKVGDTVQYTGSHHPSYADRIGLIGQVVSSSWLAFDNGCKVRFENGDEVFCSDVNLIHVTNTPRPPCDGKTGVEWSKRVDSPIVTKRHIRPGTYGVVTLTPDCTHVELMHILIDSVPTPEQLRETAHTLNQIAEVLEENTP